MSVQTTSTEETKKETPSPTDHDAKKTEAEVSSSPAAEPGKKKRKLNDGSSSKTDESTGFLASVSNFFSGTWFWPSSMPSNADASAADATAKTEVTKSEEKEPTKPTKAEDGSQEPTAPTEKTTSDEKDEEPAKPTATNETTNAEESKKDPANGDDELDQSSPEKKKKETRGKSESPKAVAVGSKKRRRLS